LNQTLLAIYDTGRIRGWQSSPNCVELNGFGWRNNNPNWYSEVVEGIMVVSRRCRETGESLGIVDRRVGDAVL
jgi:hypothetical protein